MKLLVVSILSLLLLTACGAQTDQEKAQKEGLMEGISILYDAGKMMQDGESDEAVQNTVIDRVTKGLTNITEGTDSALTEEEKKNLEKGAEMLKNNAKGLKEEAIKALNESLNKKE